MQPSDEGKGVAPRMQILADEGTGRVGDVVLRSGCSGLPFREDGSGDSAG
ncbi:MAG: hypothetical protein AAF998_00445 [Bacteroidota bacterium]